MDQQNSSLSGCSTDIPERRESRFKKAILYGICAAIVVFFIYALYLGTVPKVSRVYKMFYIDRTLSTWPGENGFCYEPGTVERCIAYDKYKDDGGDLCLRMGIGWSIDENGSTNTGNSAIIYYPINNGLPDGGELTVDISDYQGASETEVYFSYTPEKSYGELTKENTSDVLFDDSFQVTERIGSFSGKGTYTFSLPKVKDKDLNKVIFKTNDAVFTLNTAEIRRK